MLAPSGKRTPLWPYKVMLGLLYGEFTWVDREQNGVMVVPTAKWCGHFKQSAVRMRGYLEYLDELGLLDRLEWRGHYFIVQPRAPYGMTPALKTVNTEVIDV